MQGGGGPGFNAEIAHENDLLLMLMSLGLIKVTQGMHKKEFLDCSPIKKNRVYQSLL